MANIVDLKPGVQAAGIGGKIKVSGVLEVEATGKFAAGEVSIGNEPEASVSVVKTKFGLHVGKAGGSYEQKDMTYDGDEFKVRDSKGNFNAGSLKYGTDRNEISLGATGGLLSGEITFNLSAIQDTIDSSVEAVKGFFQNLIPTNPWATDEED